MYRHIDRATSDVQAHEPLSADVQAATLRSLCALKAAWWGIQLRGNCAPGMQPPNPRAPSTTAPHLRSARVVVVGPAASPAASAPIGIGALAAAGARGRRLQNLPRRELSSFLNFGMTKKAAFFWCWSKYETPRTN